MPESSLADLQSLIADVPDFPKPGIVFRDITPLLAQKFPETIAALGTRLTPDEILGIDAFAGIDSRGFVFASALAQKYNKNLVLIRKAGKLPPPVSQKSYALEYGTAALEIKPGQGRVVIVDDVLATGGTLSAAADLVHEAGYTVTALLVLINLAFLNNFTWRGQAARALATYS